MSYEILSPSKEHLDCCNLIDLWKNYVKGAEVKCIVFLFCDEEKFTDLLLLVHPLFEVNFLKPPNTESIVG